MILQNSPPVQYFHCLYCTIAAQIVKRIMEHKGEGTAAGEHVSGTESDGRTTKCTSDMSNFLGCNAGVSFSKAARVLVTCVVIMISVGIELTRFTDVVRCSRLDGDISFISDLSCMFTDLIIASG